MKKLLEVCLPTAFIVYLLVAIDLFPFETQLNPLDWDVRNILRFVIYFFVGFFFYGGAELVQNSNKEEK